MSRKTFKVKDKGKNKSKKLMSFHLDDENLSEKYKDIRTKIEDLKNIELNALPVYDDRYIKAEKKDHTAIKFILTFVA